MRRIGEDAFGPFLITGGPCTVCNDRKSNVVVKYRPSTLELPSNIDPARTILKGSKKNPADNYIGIACGCYGKLHRQVAHIVDSIKRREEKDA